MEHIPMKIGTCAFKSESISGKNVEINYKSGACYKGDLVDNKKYGKGSMYWPDGSVYHGDFVNDLRSGQGRQFYRDESSYEGQFANDKRNGHGIQKFSNGEVYEGHFFQDLRHGVGKYIWPNKCEFVGLFYANKKEGYGTAKFANGNVFKGLYKDDKREGPGILTYKDTYLQDVGLWYGQRLIRISCKIPGLFSMSQHPHYPYCKPKSPVIIAADTWKSHSLLRDLSNICNYSSDIYEKIKDIYLEYPDCCNIKVNYELYNEVFMQQASGLVDLQRTCKLWNITPCLEDLQKHILKHSFKQTLINVDDILAYHRNCFHPEGPLETISQQFLAASAFGKNEVVESILNENIIHPDVASTDGNTALINATAIGNCGILNSLLNHGANVNQLNDEGCSALTVGFVLYYSSKSLLMNLSCDTSSQLPFATLDTEGSTASDSSQVLGSGDNVNWLRNANPNRTSVLAERTNSMELESLEDCQNGSPRNMTPADDADSGISRSSQVGQGNRMSLDREQTAERIPAEIFPHASITSPNSVLRSQEKTGTLGHQETRRVYFDKHVYTENVPANKKMTELQPLELRNLSADLPNIKNEEMTKDCPFKFKSHASRPGRNLVRQSSSWWSNYQVSDWLDTMNLKKDENQGKKTSTSAFDDSPIKKETEEFTKKFVRTITRSFIPVENSNLFTSSMTPQRQEKLFVVRKNCFQECVDFLLKRGANPNSSSYPWPVLYIAVRSLDVSMVKTLLLKGASANASLSKEEGGLFPLHIACSLPGKDGYEIAELLLNSLADANARLSLDNSYLDSSQIAGCQVDSSDKTNWALSCGRTPLHIACEHEDNMEDAAKMVRLLLEKRADVNLLCNGLSPLAIAIAHGNISAVDELLSHGADPNLPLPHSVGRALCMCVLAQFKGNLTASTTVLLMNKLVKAGANILAKIPIGPKMILGTVVDFCYDLFYQDYRISHIPTHALTVTERETYKTRKEILVHVGTMVRDATIELERLKLKGTDEEIRDVPSKSKFMYTGVKQGKSKKSSETRSVTFDFPNTKYQKAAVGLIADNQTWSLLDICYECGRSMNVKLKSCTRCKEISFCGKACKMKSWATRHRYECVRIKERRHTLHILRGNSKDNTSMGSSFKKAQLPPGKSRHTKQTNKGNFTEEKSSTGENYSLE